MEIISILGEIWWQLLLAIGIWIGIVIYTRKNPEKLLERIEKNAIKVNVNEEPIYLKKSGLFVKEWRIIYPPVNEDGSINRINRWFGGKGNLVRTVIWVLLIFLVLLGVYEIISSYNAVFSDPIIQDCLKASNIIIGG